MNYDGCNTTIDFDVWEEHWDNFRNLRSLIGGAYISYDNEVIRIRGLVINEL